MSATAFGAILAVSGAYAATVFAILFRLTGRIEQRLDRIEVRLTTIEVGIAQIGQKLDDHISSHPGPTEKLVR